MNLSYTDSRVQPIKLDNKDIRRNDILFNYYIQKLFALVDVGSKVPL